MPATAPPSNEFFRTQYWRGTGHQPEGNPSLLRRRVCQNSRCRTAAFEGAERTGNKVMCSGLLNRCIPCQVPLLSWAATVVPAEALRPRGIDGDRCANAQGARLESDSGDGHRAIPKHLAAHNG